MERLNSAEKCELVKYKRDQKPQDTENQALRCQSRYETLFTKGNYVKTDNSSNIYSSSSNDTSENITKQARLIIIKRKE